MLGHQFVFRNIDQQVVFAEDLHDGRQQGRNDFQRTRSRSGLRDENAGVVILLTQQLGELLDVFDADVGIRAELDVHGADLRLFLCLAGTRERGVACLHGVAGAGGEGHFGALGRAALVGVLGAEVGEGDVAFFFGEFVALRMCQQGLVRVVDWKGGSLTLSAHICLVVRRMRHRRDLDIRSQYGSSRILAPDCCDKASRTFHDCSRPSPSSFVIPALSHPRVLVECSFRKESGNVVTDGRLEGWFSSPPSVLAFEFACGSASAEMMCMQGSVRVRKSCLPAEKSGIILILLVELQKLQKVH